MEKSIQQGRLERSSDDEIPFRAFVKVLEVTPGKSQNLQNNGEDEG